MSFGVGWDRQGCVFSNGLVESTDVSGNTNGRKRGGGNIEVGSNSRQRAFWEDISSSSKSSGSVPWEKLWLHNCHVRMNEEKFRVWLMGLEL